MTTPTPSHWVPDEEGAGCSLCHTEFSLTLRRHHCRKCGGLVCSSCSNHFLVLDATENGGTPVRVCDRCEIQISDAHDASEELDVNDKINLSLKASLKEMAHEIEKFQSLLIHIIGEKAAEIPSDNRLEVCADTVHSVCANLAEVSSKYSNHKMESHELEQEIRKVAQRCLRAESVSREAVDITREIERYSKQIGNQDRLIMQLNERIDRLTNPVGRGVPRTPPRSPSPPPSRVSATVLTASPVVPIADASSPHPPSSVNVCQILKALISI